MTEHFAAVEKFGPDDGERWFNYVAWSGLTQLEELVSLDGNLCKSLPHDLIADDWAHISDPNGYPWLFDDLHYLLNRAVASKSRNILCVFKNPAALPELPPSAVGFDFLGFDLIEAQSCTSALSNCGGFPDVFANEELSQQGLIVDFARAKAVQRDLVRAHPEEAHADCDLWAIFRSHF